MWKDEVRMSVGCLMLRLIEEIGEIRKSNVDRVTAEIIIGVITRMAVKEISGSTARIDFRGMIEDLTIEDTNLEMGVKMTILVEGTAGIEINRGATHVLYHEIYTGDKPLVVSRPYHYDRVKQEILDYHIEEMLKDGPIVPIQSPYASPVVLCRKNNGLPPDNPEAYRFPVDYGKFNSITKYPHYPLPLIDD
ncbi:retrovirus-related Pol polyprotein from transposon 17.6 [Trichonephila clavipes]|nr:retrovirus-related Pol polyprotein from transposon 17.6 [Trichonephila clavipes]